MASPPFNPDETKPQGSDIISNYPAVERTFRDIIESWLLVEHNRDGQHDQVTLEDQAGSTPSGVANHVTIWQEGGVIKVRDGTGAVEEILKALVDDTSPQLGGNLDLNGSGLTFPGATVTDVTGSDTLAVSGTAGTNGNLAEWNGDGDLVDGPDVLDEDDMSSDSATALATQQSIKAYVDTEVGNVGGPTLATAQATTSGTSVTFGSISAGVNQIDVMLDRVSVNDAGLEDEVGVRIGDSGGIETTGYLSQIQITDAFDSSTTNFQLFGGTTVGLGYDTASQFSGILSLRRLTGNVWVVHGAIGDQNSYIATITGKKELSGELTQVELFASGASFDNGQVSIQYQ